MTKLKPSSARPQPRMELLLTPTYPPASISGQPPIPDGIVIKMGIKAWPARFHATSPLLTHVLSNTLNRSVDYDWSDFTVTDSSGKKLGLQQKDAEGMRTWYLIDNPADGDIDIKFLAVPLKLGKGIQLGSRIDLRQDPNGGVMGKGKGFIPVVPCPCYGNGVSECTHKPEQWLVSVAWDLCKAPEGTRGACSHGDGRMQPVQGSLDDCVSDTVFTVGLLRRYPAWGEPTQIHIPGVSEPTDFAVYWCGDTIFDMSSLSPTISGIFRSIAAFFSSPNPFRVFFREIQRVQGGIGAYNSFMIEYSLESKGETTQESTSELLAHEAIHEYALLQAPKLEKGYLAAEGAWYVEGIAEYYGAISPFRGGVSDRAQLIRTLNGFAQSYYTTPVRSMDFHEVLRRYWDNVYITRVSYARGIMYLACENARIRSATNGAKSMDDVALELYRRRVAGELHRLEEYRSIVADIIGREEEERNYEAMIRGDMIIPSVDCFADLGIKLVRRDAEKFEVGFDPNSLRDNIIKGLIKGSRAEAAGVREGDKVLASWMVWIAADKLERNMQMTVDRDGEEKVIEWWPRSDEKVPCWFWEEA